MARMHARRRGRSSSKKPASTTPPNWLTMTKEEVEEKVMELARAGNPPAKVGLLMRDQYGVPNVRQITGQKLTKHLASKGVRTELPEDLSSLLRRAVKLNSLLEGHPRDRSNKRRFQLLESKIRRLEKYYRREGRLPAGWRYSLESAAVQVE
jgi:small subunit ribosomal protein S15